MILLFACLLVFAAVARFVPHPANFAPIAALGIFVGLYGNKKQALVLPLLARLVSDALIGFDAPLIMASIYIATIISSFLGIWAKQKKSFLNIGTATLVGSICFYIFTNLSVWAFTDMYPKNLAGLASSFTLALPFFRNTLLGDIFYVTLLIGSYELARNAGNIKEIFSRLNSKRVNG